MKKFLVTIFIGFILGILFIFFGGLDYIKDTAEDAATSFEKYEKGMAGMKERAEKVKKKAEEAGKRMERYIP